MNRMSNPDARKDMVCRQRRAGAREAALVAALCLLGLGYAVNGLISLIGGAG